MAVPRSRTESREGPRKLAHRLGARLRAGDAQTIDDINGVIARHDGNVARAAVALGVGINTLRSWIKQVPALGPIRDHRGASPRTPRRHRRLAGALLAITEGDDQVHVEALLLRRHRGAVATLTDELRRCFGSPRVHCTSATIVAVTSTDGCAVRAVISAALDAAGVTHYWLLGARRSRAVAS